ncbi:hypothetical protein QUF64_07500 [Anaerolineales bacterium HSG6]|nr:hypothetical protein [Anaerolineales bacterium HSG6]
MFRPKRFSRSELAKFKIDVLKEQGQVFLKCQECGKIWLPKTNQRGRLAPDYWRCPNQELHSQNPTKEEVAYHEAGHAVIAHYLGIAIDYATIEPNKNIVGQVRYTISLDKLPPSQQVMITLAGPIAEDMVTASPRFVTFEDLMTYSASDGHGVLRVINKYQDQVDMDGHYEVATYLLNKYRPAVEAVAQALLDEGKLLGENLVAMIDASRKSG